MDLAKKRLFLLDLDGTLYLEETLLPGAAEFLAYVRSHGGAVRYLTNNSSRGVDAGLEKMHRLGVPAAGGVSHRRGGHGVLPANPAHP